MSPVPLIYKQKFCLHCGTEIINFQRRMQKFCSLTTGRQCARAFKKLVIKIIENLPPHRRAKRKWELYNPEKVAEMKARWRSKNPEKVKASRDKWWINNKEKTRRAVANWRMKNQQRIREYKKDWRAKNRFKIRIENKKYYEKRKLRQMKEPILIVCK